MNNIEISVVITTYKRTTTLKRAITSVLNQTYQKFEIIVVDDNATPEMVKKIDEIITSISDSRIKVIHNKANLGGALARNVGIENAEGEYVAFLDDDDEYLPSKLEKQLELMKKSNDKNLALVYCWDQIINEDGSVFYTHRGNAVGHCYYEGMYDCIASTSLWLCRKECLINVGMFTDTPCKQDSYVIVKLLTAGYKVDRVPEILLYYYHDGGVRISTGNHLKRIQGEEFLRTLCRKYYNLISSKQRKNVEYAFSCRLLPHYFALSMRDESIEAAKNIIRYPFKRQSLSVYKSCLRLVLSRGSG